MKETVRYGIAGAGALALVASVLTGALASRPPSFQDLTASKARTTTFNGNVRVKHVLRVDNNTSVYGKTYAHGGLQSWKQTIIHDGGLTVNAGGLTVAADGLTVQAGGIKTDSLSASGPIQAASATITGNLTSGTLQTGQISGATLATTGAATFGGAVSVAAKLTASAGIDAGSGGLTTTGNITTGGLSTNTLNATGALTAQSATVAGAVTATSAALQTLAVTGSVNFTGATVTGLNLGNLGAGTLNNLTVGSTASSTPPLLIQENGAGAQVGVDSNGALTTQGLVTASDVTVGGALTVNHSAAVNGDLTVNGAHGITASALSAPTPSNSTTPGALTLTGSTITLAGATTANNDLTLANGADLNLSAATTANGATHINARGDGDVAGQVTIGACPTTVATAPCRVSQSFATPYTTRPIVTLTPYGDPETGGNAMPKYWVTVDQNTSGQYTGFTVNYVPEGTFAPTVTSVTAIFNYQVIGS